MILPDINFKLFQLTIRSVLSFRSDWDIDEWNDQYVMFAETILHWNEKYVETKTGKEIIAEWAKEFYQESSPDTHTYWLKK